MGRSTPSRGHLTGPCQPGWLRVHTSGLCASLGKAASSIPALFRNCVWTHMRDILHRQHFHALLGVHAGGSVAGPRVLLSLLLL